MKTTLLLATCAAIVAPAAFAVEAKVIIDKTVDTFNLLASAGDVCQQALDGKMPSAEAAQKVEEIQTKILAIKKEILEFEEKSKADGSHEEVTKQVQAYMTSPEGMAVLSKLQPSMESLGKAAQGSDQVLAGAVMKLIGALQ